MAAKESKASVVPEDNWEDAPPSYHSSTTGVPYTKPGSSAEGIITIYIFDCIAYVTVCMSENQHSLHF